jgi:hypothetical protein
MSDTVGKIVTYFTALHSGVPWRLEVLLWYRVVSRWCVLSRYKTGTEGEEANPTRTFTEKSISIITFVA